jgi:CRP/FNR family transcriptional regulator, cyclic AMP receptor protein
MSSLHRPQPAESCQKCSLRREGFFCNLSSASLRDLDSLRLTTSYPQGAMLFGEGDSPQGVMVLCKGRVKVSMNSSDGRTMILRVVKPGEVLGLHAVVSNRPYQATAETLEPCQVSFVRREDFLRLLKQHGDASMSAAAQLSNNYQTACDQVRALGLSHSAPEKMARFLLDWAASGQQTQQGMRARLTLTHEEIGQIIGTSRETVTRTLGEFRNHNYATLKGSMLFIQNRAALGNFIGV